MSYMIRQVRPDGALAGVSDETFPYTRAEHYREMPRDAVVPRGPGPLLTAIRSYVEMREAAEAGEGSRAV